MKRSRPTKLLLGSLLLALAACGGPTTEVRPVTKPEPTSKVTPPPQPSASANADPEAFRREPPPAGPEVTFVPPKIEEARLSNGARVLVVERHDLPLVAFQIVFDRGADQGSPGLGSFMASMLLQGTKTRSAIAISDELAKLGASYDSWGDFDTLGVGARCLAPKFSAVLSIMADIVTAPRFDEAEIKRERAKRMTSLLQQNDRPATILSNTIVSTLYPAGHPYATPLIGTEEEVSKITKADLAKFHAAHMQPDHMIIAVAGDLTKAKVVEELERVFGGWKGAAAPASDPAAPPPPAEGAPRVVLVDRPGAVQSFVAAALPGVPRKTKDFEALVVMNTILGGKFTSRLNLNLREKHAYTYGARSGFEMRHGPGPFSAGGPVVRESTGPALAEVLAEIKRIRGELVSEEELSDAQSNVILQLPARFETVGDTAGSIAALAEYGLPLDEYANRAAKIRAVTREDVKRVAAAYLSPEKMRLIVVGDAKVVEGQLAQLGFGSMDVRRAPPPAEEKGVRAPGQSR